MPRRIEEDPDYALSDSEEPPKKIVNPKKRVCPEVSPLHSQIPSAVKGEIDKLLSDLYSHIENENLTPHEMKSLKKLQDLFNSKSPTLKKILSSKLSPDDMLMAYNLYNLMNQTQYESPDHLSYLNKINFILEQKHYNLETLSKLRVSESEKRKVVALYTQMMNYHLYDSTEWIETDEEIRTIIREEIKSDEILDQLNALEKDQSMPIPTRQKVAQLNTSISNQKIILNLLSNNDSAHVSRAILYTKLPYGITTAINFQPTKGHDYLDKELYGMNKAKSKIISVLIDRNRNPEEPCIIALKGKAGTGKTSIAMAIAKMLGLPFSKISLAGAEDSSIICGQNSSWVGSGPGSIINELIKHGTSNPVILLDEVDKIADTPKGKGLEDTLLHLLDKTQNSQFTDNFLSEIPHDLSRVFFILTLNDESALNPILKDRLTVIDVPSYTSNELIEICTQFIIPKILKKRKLGPEDIIFAKGTCNKILRQVGIDSNSSGIRVLEGAISEIISKICMMEEGIFVLVDGKRTTPENHPIKFTGYPFTVTPTMVEHFIEEKAKSQQLFYIS